MSDPAANDFEKAISAGSTSIVSDFWYLLRSNRKWWLIPIVLVLLVFGVLVLLGGTAAAPFIYTLF